MLSCNVVIDLLPNYIDGLVSGRTEQEIIDHISGCADCQSVYEKMKTPLSPIVVQDENELDYLKKIREKNRIRTVKYSSVSTGIVLVLVAVFLFIFIRGISVDSGDIDYRAIVGTNGNYGIDMTLLTNSALVVRTEMDYEGEGESRKLKKIILIPRQVPVFIAEGNSYFFGINGSTIEDFKQGRFSFEIQFSDKTVGLEIEDFIKHEVSTDD